MIKKSSILSRIYFEEELEKRPENEFLDKIYNLYKDYEYHLNSISKDEKEEYLNKIHYLITTFFDEIPIQMLVSMYYNNYNATPILDSSSKKLIKNKEKLDIYLTIIEYKNYIMTDMISMYYSKYNIDFKMKELENIINEQRIEIKLLIDEVTALKTRLNNG